MDGRKRCQGCKSWKTPSWFWKNATRPDGLQDLCKPCLTEVQKRTPGNLRRAEEGRQRAAARAAERAERERVAREEWARRRAVREAARAARVASKGQRRKRTPLPAVPAGHIQCVACRKVKPFEDYPPSALYPAVRGRRCEQCFPVVRAGIAFV
jgi:hypothetical protein